MRYNKKLKKVHKWQYFTKSLLFLKLIPSKSSLKNLNSFFGRMEEIQLEDNSFWHFFDSTQQLVIDSATTQKHKSIIIFINLYSLVIIIISIFSPKSHRTKFSESLITNPQNALVESVIDTEGLNTFNKTVSVYFSAKRKPRFHNNSDFHKHHRYNQKYGFYHNSTVKRDFRISADIKYFSNQKEIKIP